MSVQSCFAQVPCLPIAKADTEDLHQKFTLGGVLNFCDMILYDVIIQVTLKCHF
jgi:hypothetical protein